MIYITNNKEISNSIIRRHHPENRQPITITELNQLLKLYNELIFIVDNQSLKESDTSFDILMKIFDITKIGCFPRILKGDILIFKWEEDNFYRVDF